MTPDPGRFHLADPELAALRLDFTKTLREVFEVMSAGLLARGGRDDRGLIMALDQ